MFGVKRSDTYVTIQGSYRYIAIRKTSAFFSGQGYCRSNIFSVKNL
jgi:hypothetical protein